MYATVAKSISIRDTLRYNEQKVTLGKADFLWGENFVKDTSALSLRDKLDRFSERIAMNHRNVPKTVHLFVTFSPKDELSNEKMIKLSRHYMDGVGFGEQPYLVYRHLDTAHHHLHIASTNVRADGSLIRIGLKELYHSHYLTRQMETSFSLVPRHRTTLEEQTQFQVNHALKVIYGEAPLKRAISDVLNTVVDHYKYTSLNELNAVLRQYNVYADKGREGSKLYQNRGLVYYALDDHGRQVSMYLNASSFSLKPTLPYLENKFVLNERLRENQRLRITTAIEWTFATRSPDWKGFLQGMQREGINVFVQETRDKRPADIYFIDFQGKSIFSGENLGAQFSLRSIQDRCVQEQQLQHEETQRLHLKLRL